MTPQEIKALADDIFSEIPIDCDTDEIADILEELESIINRHVNKV